MTSYKLRTLGRVKPTSHGLLCTFSAACSIRHLAVLLARWLEQAHSVWHIVDLASQKEVATVQTSTANSRAGSLCVLVTSLTASLATCDRCVAP